MEIKPIHDTNTIKLSIPVQQTSLKRKVIKDPEGVISNGIYKVIRWEKLRQIVTIGLSASIFLAMAILITLYATAFKTKWIGFIIPVVIILISGSKLSSTLIERSAFLKAIIKYREDLRIGIAHNPPFIVRMYSKLNIKQVAHNWITFFLLFNGGIITLLLWGLKDVHWWIFKFDLWIENIFHNPNLMQWLFSIGLVVIAIIHIIFAIQRKKRILDIDSYFGSNIVSKADLEAEKEAKNKFWRRLFITYILVVLVIPIIVKWIIKFIRRKK